MENHLIHTHDEVKRLIREMIDLAEEAAPWPIEG
jgi:hypothetical protein